MLTRGASGPFPSSAFLDHGLSLRVRGLARNFDSDMVTSKKRCFSSPKRKKTHSIFIDVLYRHLIFFVVYILKNSVESEQPGAVV